MFAGRTEPDLTAQLVKALSSFMPLSTLQVGHTLYRRPNELAKIVLESDDSAPFSLTPVARKIDFRCSKRFFKSGLPRCRFTRVGFARSQRQNARRSIRRLGGRGAMPKRYCRATFSRCCQRTSVLPRQSELPLYRS